MLVNSVGKSEIQLYKNNSNKEPFESAGTGSTGKSPGKTADFRTVHFETAKTAARIASKYQVRSSTAMEMADMSNELFTAGMISQDEHQALSYNRDLHFDYFDFAKRYPETGIAEPPKRDFIQIWKENLSHEVEKQNYKKAETAEKIVNILENLELVNPSLPNHPSAPPRTLLQ